MSLSKRLNEMERRIRVIEQWKGDVEQAIADDAPAHVEPGDDELDQHHAGERDQTQSLG